MMCCYKKKPRMGLGKLMVTLFAILGVAAAAYAILKLIKKLCHFCKGKKPCACGDGFSGLDLTLGEKEPPLGCCCVTEDSNDLRSENNAVVNSENRMLNIENEA